MRVRLLVEGDLTDAKSVKYASRAATSDLLAAGIEIHEFQPTMMHVKAMVVDGAWSIVGSANFDNRSFELNDEINVGIVDPRVAARGSSADFEADLRRSTRAPAAARVAGMPVRGQGTREVLELFGEPF